MSPPLPSRRPLVLALVAAVIALGGCGGGDGQPARTEPPSPSELETEEPEAAVADLPGVGSVERHMEIEEDEFYENEVVVDAEAGATADELAAIETVLAFYDRGPKPVTGTIYLDAGTTEVTNRDAPERTALFAEPGPQSAQLERAEVFLTALDEFDGADVVVDGDSLAVTPGGIGSDAEIGADEVVAIARTIRGGELAEVADATVRSDNFLISVDAEGGDRSLAAFEAILAAAEEQPGLDLARLTIAPLVDHPRSAAVDACIRLEPETPAAEQFYSSTYSDEVGPFLVSLLDVYGRLGTDASLDVTTFSEQPADVAVCSDLLTVKAGRAEPDPLGRGWDALAEGILSGGGDRSRR